MTNLTPATGRHGTAGSALFFSGSGGSTIRIPQRRADQFRQDQRRAVSSRILGLPTVS